jgi:DNA polymerase elongation subunit (family B)
MESFYKKNYINLAPTPDKPDLEFQVIEWHAQDDKFNDSDSDSDSEGGSGCNHACGDLYTIRCYGVTAKGVSVTCKITGFTPFYYIKVPSDFNKQKLNRFLTFIKNSWLMQKKVNDEWVNYYSDCLLAAKCAIVSKKDLYGFRNGKEYKFVRLVFNNYTAMNKSKYIFKKAVSIDGINKTPIKYKLYESNFEPFMRFCHIKDILMSGWLRLPRGDYKRTHSEATTQIEVEINWNKIVSLKDRKEIANFLQASWDIETYSYDGTFPDPNLKNKKINGTTNVMDLYPNVIYQIATTFRYYKESKMCVKHLLTLKKCDPIKMGCDNVPVVVEECKNEKDLILRWAKLISKMDPDILYTYNGDTFDCYYLYERAKLYGIDGDLTRLLSRSSLIPTSVKKETFSSSAYGDSDFLRFYIPGRLNYDLLIHYKRGMKKYPSYKLDYIASEILGEGKLDVSAKDIFSFYKEGRPDQIKRIGEYCLMDTELLQRLVDKQLVLVTIIQLANVTYVPIGFLITRGQTIKVYSQLLRKARQMNFLVPHTNFNEDNYPINVKCKLPHNLEDHIGEYIEINCGRTQGPYNSKTTKFNGKIAEITNELEFVVLSDTEITHDYFNVKYRKLKGSDSVNNHQEFIISRLYSSDDLVDDSFTGATVLEAQSGMYTENISVLDFASLYPTIMISRNLCYSTFVFDEKYKNIPNVNYETIAWDDKVEYRLRHNCEAVGKSGKSKGQVCGKQAFFEVKNDENSNSMYYCRIHDPLKKLRDASEKFQKRDVSYNYTIVQPHYEVDENGEKVKVNMGVIPALLEELYAARKQVKREMAKAIEDGDKLLEDILNSTQLAIKISLNSCYGFLGRRQGNLILKELGSIVTAVGRSLINQSKEYAEGPFLDYVKENCLLKQKIEFDQNIVKKMSEREKDSVLFKTLVTRAS